MREESKKNVGYGRKMENVRNETKYECHTHHIYEASARTLVDYRVEKNIYRIAHVPVENRTVLSHVEPLELSKIVSHVIGSNGVQKVDVVVGMKSGHIRRRHKSGSEYFHSFVQIVIDDETVSHSNAMRLHRMPLTVMIVSDVAIEKIRNSPFGNRITLSFFNRLIHNTLFLLRHHNISLPSIFFFQSIDEPKGTNKLALSFLSFSLSLSE